MTAALSREGPQAYCTDIFKLPDVKYTQEVGNPLSQSQLPITTLVYGIVIESFAC